MNQVRLQVRLTRLLLYKVRSLVRDANLCKTIYKIYHPTAKTRCVPWPRRWLKRQRRQARRGDQTCRLFERGRALSKNGIGIGVALDQVKRLDISGLKKNGSPTLSSVSVGRPMSKRGSRTSTSDESLV